MYLNFVRDYPKNSGTKLNDRSDNGNCESATRNCNKIEELSEKLNKEIDWFNITVVRRKS